MSTLGKSSELVVADSDYNYASKKFINYGNHLNDLINEYIKVLEYVTAYGIKDEKITESINELLSEVRKYPEAIRSVSEEISVTISGYITKIDSADKFIY